MEKYYTTKEAAIRLNRKPGTLENWRYAGKGPKYREPDDGVIYYTESDLQAWMDGEKQGG